MTKEDQPQNRLDPDRSPIPGEGLVRDALTRRRVLLGGAAVAAATTLAAVPRLGAVPAAAATAGAEVSWQPAFLSRQQAALLSRLCDLILPRTATPGALDAEVPQYIDLAVSLADPDERLSLFGGLGWIDARASSRDGKAFLSLSEAEQVALLREISDEHAGHPKELEPGAAFFADLKRRTLFAYFTSEKGRVEALGRPAEVEREIFRGCTHSGDDHSV